MCLAVQLTLKQIVNSLIYVNLAIVYSFLFIVHLVSLYYM